MHQKANQPWKTISPSQLQFILDAVCNHEFADLAVKHNVNELQDRFDWMWNMYQANTISYEKAIEGIWNGEYTQEQFSSFVGKRIQSGDTNFNLSVGDKCFLLTGKVYKPVEILKITLDLGCAYGGLHPIFIEFSVDNETREEWIDCFGETANGEKFVKECNPDLVNVSYQEFLEVLYMSEQWSNFIHLEKNHEIRKEITEAIWQKILKENKSSNMSLNTNDFWALVQDSLEASHTI